MKNNGKRGHKTNPATHSGQQSLLISAFRFAMQTYESKRYLSLFVKISCFGIYYLEKVKIKSRKDSGFVKTRTMLTILLC